MHDHKKTFIVGSFRHPRFSDVKNDCISLCVPTTKGESLASVLIKLCGKITSLQSQITALQATVADLQSQIDELEP